MLANNEIRKLYLNVKTYNEATDLSSIEFIKNRLFIFLPFIVVTFIIVIRLVYLDTYSIKFLSKQMSTRIERSVKKKAMRGTVVDRNDKPLAVSTPMSSIWINPQEVNNLTIEKENKLSKILDMSIIQLNNKFNQQNKTFVYLKRQITPKESEYIRDLKIKGVYSKQEFKRYYPTADVSSQLIGLNNIDDKGISGIEYANNSDLIGKDGMQRFIMDRQGDVVENLDDGIPVHNGKQIKLSVDIRLQYIAYDALKEQVEKLHAKGGSVVILDAKTGEVLTMVNVPSFNSNQGNIDPKKMTNMAITNVYDPGSIMKPLVIAKALNDKLVSPQTIIVTKPYYVGHKLIKDDEPKPLLSVRDIIVHSSDIGTSKIALKYQPYQLWSYYKSLGFGEKLGSKFPGETSGILLNWKKWKMLDQALMSYGYGISVSLFQMVHAYTIFTNNGCIVPLTFYKTDGLTGCKQVISSQTANTVKEFLADTTQRGTAIKAQLDDYTTGGKTGTAQKLINGHYSEKNHISSFVGFAPNKTPRLIIGVMIDDPKDKYYAATVAAPVFATIAKKSLHILNISPDKF